MTTRTRIPSFRLLALATLLLALALASGRIAFTGASMTDGSRSSAALSAGTLQLTVGGAGQPLLSAAGLAPGRSASGSATLASGGDLPATAVVRATGIADVPASPALSGVLTLTISERASGAQLWSGTLAALAAGTGLGTLQPGVARTLDLRLAWPSAARDAGLQGASTSFQLVWSAEAGFTASAANPQTVTATADFVAPSASAATLQKSQGGVPGFVRPGGGYRVFANAADSGNPASGIATATADASALTSGARAAALSAGSFTIAGQSYNRATTTLSAGSLLTNGPATLALAFADVAGNSATQPISGVTVDGVAPTAAGIQIVNGSGTAGTPDAGDVVTFTYSEPIDPISLIAGWDGSAAAVTVDLANSSSADTLSVSRSGSQLPLGVLALNANVVSSTTRFNATLQVSGSTVVATLGSLVSGSPRGGSSASIRWSPSTAAYDRAANTASSAGTTESGGADRDF